jgi:dipeptidyl aminopeptidase/acylaminoacyl peptidase
MRNAIVCTVTAALTVLTLGASASVTAQQARPVLRQEIGNLVLENIPEHDPALREKLDRYLQARSATFLDWLPDGSMLITTRFGDVNQIHRVASPLGTREQLTWFTEPITAARAPQVATGEGFVFMKDRGGDENSQVHYLRLSDRSVRMLTDGKSRHGAPVWSNNGKRVAFFGTGRDGVSHDIYVADVDAGTAPRLTVGAQQDAWYPLDWSLDDQRLLLMKIVSVNEGYLFIADVNTGSLTQLYPEAGSRTQVGISGAMFAPDGRGVLIVSDQGSEFMQLRYFDSVTRESRLITDDIPWDVEEFDASSDGRYIAYVTNEDGRSRLTVVDTVMKLELSPAGLPSGVIVNVRFDRDGRRLALSAESATSPRDVYVYDLNRNAVERWTHSEPGPVDAGSFVAPELIRYPTWDRVGRQQRTISAFVYRPRTPGPHPVVVSIHGGPESQYRPVFEPFTQFLVNELGFAVIAPNVRGSSGYGKSFLKLDNGMLREDSVKDIGSLLVWIGLQPNLDRERIFVMGGSYGGYMTLASLVKYSDRLRGGIDVVGISNFVTFLTNTSPYRRDLRRVEYGDERDPRMRNFLTRISPLNNAQAIRRPLLVVQGLNDPRVPASESEQMVARIRANGGEVWYLAAKDEGHGFRKKPNRDFYLATAAMFLQKLAAPAPGEAITSLSGR